MRGENCQTSVTNIISAVQSQRRGESNNISTCVTASSGSTVNTVNTENSVSAAGLVNDQPLIPLMAAGTEWASVAASSPISTGNRFASLFNGQSDDLHTDADDQPFTEVRRSKRRRIRTRSDLQQQQQQQQNSDDSRQGAQQQQRQRQQQQQDVRQRSRRVLVGKGTSTSDDRRLGAAKKIVKKAVFCVDNITTSCTADDLRSFVTSMSVNVLSCFPAVPRRRRDERDPITDRRAFRLCIADCDRNRLLDASKWPDSVTVSEWYHIPPSEAAERRQRVNGRTESVRTAQVSRQPDTTPSTAIPGASSSVATAPHCSSTPSLVDVHPTDMDAVENSVDDTNDATITYNHGVTTDAASEDGHD